MMEEQFYFISSLLKHHLQGKSEYIIRFNGTIYKVNIQDAIEFIANNKRCTLAAIILSNSVEVKPEEITPLGD